MIVYEDSDVTQEQFLRETSDSHNEPKSKTTHVRINVSTKDKLLEYGKRVNASSFDNAILKLLESN